MLTFKGLVQESSWGESLQAYKQEKNNLPWRSEDAAGATKVVSKYDISRKERAFDPVLMKYRDNAAEDRRREMETTCSANRLNEARAKQLHYEQTFNIVNHESHLPKSRRVDRTRELLETKPRMPDTRAPYNILSNVGHVEHEQCGLLAPPASARPEQDPKGHVRKYGGEGGELPKSHDEREFNILSNKYTESHVERNKRDRELMKREAALRFWQTHNYNFITGSFYDQRKETAFQDKLKQLEAVQGKSQVARMPPSVQYSEGVIYDIIHHDVKDECKMSEASGVGNRTLKSKKGAQVEALVHTRGEREEEIMANRSLHRVSHKRFEEDTKHGYDPITNQGFKGKNNKPPAQPSTQPPQRVWAKLHADNSLSLSQSGTMGTIKPRDLSGAAGGTANSSRGKGAAMTATATPVVPNPPSARARNGASAGAGDNARAASAPRPPVVPALNLENAMQVPETSRSEYSASIPASSVRTGGFA